MVSPAITHIFETLKRVSSGQWDSSLDFQGDAPSFLSKYAQPRIEYGWEELTRSKNLIKERKERWLLKRYNSRSYNQEICWCWCYFSFPSDMFYLPFAYIHPIWVFSFEKLLSTNQDMRFVMKEVKYLSRTRSTLCQHRFHGSQKITFQVKPYLQGERWHH